MLEAHEDKPLGELIYPALRSLLFELDRVAGAGNKVRRGLAVLRSFIGSIKITSGDLALGLDIEPAKGTADSGDLDVDLPNLFVAIAEAAEDRQSAVAILIDEIQYLSQKELGAIIMAMHKMQQKQLPLVLLAAGLPVLPAWRGSQNRMPSGCSIFRMLARCPSRMLSRRCTIRPWKQASNFSPMRCAKCSA